MLVIDNGDAIRGIAEVATQLDFIVNGYVGTTATQLADGQIGSTEGDLYLSSADATVVTSITVVNTDSAARTFTLFLKPSGGTSRAISPISLDLGIGHSFYTDGQRVVVLDKSGNVLSTTTVLAHVLGGSSHDADTLSNLNSKISDATLVDTGDIILKALLTTQNDIITRNGSTPIRLNIGASRFVARLAAGNLVAATVAEILTLLGVEAGATADLTGLEIVTLLEALASGNRLDHGAGLTGLGDDDHTQYILKTLLDAHSILIAVSDNTPVVLAVAASRFVGRKASGNIAAMTGAEALAILSGQAGAAFDWGAQNLTNLGTLSAFDMAGDLNLAGQSLIGATDSALVIRGKRQTAGNGIIIYTTGPSGGGYVDTVRVAFTGGATESVMALTDIKVNGLKLGEALDANGNAINLPENSTIILDALLSADEKWSGISEIGTMGYAATVGDLVYLAVADTKWELAKADVASTSKGKIGLVLATTNENSTCQVLLYGKMRSAAFPAFTVGAPVHISAATAGDMVVVAPSGTTGFVVRIIGYGNTAEDLYFKPDNTYIKLA